MRRRSLTAWLRELDAADMRAIGRLDKDTSATRVARAGAQETGAPRVDRVFIASSGCYIVETMSRIPLVPIPQTSDPRLFRLDAIDVSLRSRLKRWFKSAFVR